MPLRKVLPLSPARPCREAHFVPKHPLGPGPVRENQAAPALQVLHCQPLDGKGKYLQFQSFDEEYVRRLRAGDTRVQDHFVRYFTALIQIKLRSRLRSKDAIEDVRQETFTRFYAALHDDKILQPQRLGSFVNSICNHVLLEHYRNSTRDSSMEDEQDKDFPAKNVDLLGWLAAQQTGKRIREILDQMPERDRRLLREVFLEERDKDEVCRDFGVSREYLRVLLHRAKESFKSLYRKNIGEDPPELALA